MPEITVTESQRERLEAIQEEIESAYIDTYGHIRTTDVVQYLLDTYTPPEQQGDVAHERIATAEFGALQAVATDVEGVPGSGIDAETMRGELLSTLGVGEFAARLADVEGGDAESGVEDDAAETSEADESSSETPSTAETDADDDSEPETDADDEAADETDVGEETGDETDAGEEVGDETDAGAETETDDSGGSTSTSAAANDGPGAVLSAANQLLTDHEDKWRKGGSDSPYEVDLPDGTTETVRTKDDVRGLLFKHY